MCQWSNTYLYNDHISICSFEPTNHYCRRILGNLYSPRDQRWRKDLGQERDPVSMRIRALKYETEAMSRNVWWSVSGELRCDLCVTFKPGESWVYLLTICLFIYLFIYCQVSLLVINVFMMQQTRVTIWLASWTLSFRYTLLHTLHTFTHVTHILRKDAFFLPFAALFLSSYGI